MINPMAIMQLKGLLDKFKENHPKIPMFFKAASQKIEEGCVIEISVTDPQGKKMTTNMRVSNEDLDLFKQFKDSLS